MPSLCSLTARGFKSFAQLDLELNSGVNVLVGANGAGKSNLLSLFHFLGELRAGRLQSFVAARGYASRLLYYGAKTTPELFVELRFGEYGYEARLRTTAADTLYFESERLFYAGSGPEYRFPDVDLGVGHQETKVPKEESTALEAYRNDPAGLPMRVVGPMYWWRVYDFLDTTSEGPLRVHQPIHDARRLWTDGGNVAPFLLRLRQTDRPAYDQIRDVVRLMFPQFGDFVLDPEPGQQMIQLLWREQDSDMVFLPDQLSDGTLRFICLATLLLQPRRDYTGTLFIDEPELGLHPAALNLLADLVRVAAKRWQIVMATQSVSFLDAFSPQEVIVVDRGRDSESGRYASMCRRLDGEEYAAWLEEYTLGELWLKNVLGGRP